MAVVQAFARSVLRREHKLGDWSMEAAREALSKASKPQRVATGKAVQGIPVEPPEIGESARLFLQLSHPHNFLFPCLRVCRC